MSKVRRERNSFSSALKAAETRLTKALGERTKKLKELGALDAEIPALQQTIAALQQQLHPNAVTFRNSKTGQETTPSGEIRVPPIPEGLPRPDLSNLPPEIAKHLVMDLSGMSSIPAPAPEEKNADPATDTK